MPETKNVSGEYKLRVNGTTCLHVTPDGINGALGATTPAAITGTTGAFTTITVDTTTLVTDAANNRVGVGTASPQVPLDVLSAAGVQIQARDGTVTQFVGYCQSTAAYIGTFSSHPCAVLVGNQEAARFDVSRNFLIGGTSSPASAVGALAIFNGTAPSASVTNGVVLYSEDVTASAELKVRDEAGNITTLSPHNFSLIPDGPSEPLAWAYYSERDGRKINVDMLKAMRVLERISGETLVHEGAA